MAILVFGATKTFDKGPESLTEKQRAFSRAFQLSENESLFVMAGHSRLKDGVASARLCPAIHVLLAAIVKERRGCPAQGRA
jgi:hypothetical protein